MCDHCMKHGAGGAWYLNAESYTEEVASRYNLREFLLEQYKNFEQISVRKVAGFSPVGHDHLSLVRPARTHFFTPRMGEARPRSTVSLIILGVVRHRDAHYVVVALIGWLFIRVLDQRQVHLLRGELVVLGLGEQIS